MSNQPIAKVYIEGFRGPWGWVPHFEKFLMDSHGTNLEPTDKVDDADIIFQCDPTNWRKNEPWINHPDGKIVIGNVLDFADWHDGIANPEVEKYVDLFCSRANFCTAISDNVIGKLKDRGVDAEMFYYPSQVDDNIIKETRNIPKQNRFISFCRLGDPGKRIELAVRSFLDSGLASRGWQYFLIGPEPPRFTWERHPSVKVFPYMDKSTLYSLVASSMATIMPSDGEGLGLPAIESLLVNTVPIVRKVEPMTTVLGDLARYFETDNDLTVSMLDVEEELKNSTFPVAYISNLFTVSRWERGFAFFLLKESLERWYE